MLSLGINYSQMHDSSAALVCDGELLFAIAEERLSRVKHDARFPARAIQACLQYAGIRAADLDFICYGWTPAGDTFRHDLSCYARGGVPASYFNILNSSLLFLRQWHQRGGQQCFEARFGRTKARILYTEHHLAHALSAYAYSGLEPATILVVDGRGAWEATSVWRGRDGKIEHLKTINWPNSIGLFYAEFTQYLGFEKYSDEWKVMGLAPYGKPGADLGQFIRIGDGSYRVNSRLLIGDGRHGSAGITAKLGPPREPETEVEDRHRDIAFAVQQACENALLELAKDAIGRSGFRNLCLAGGVALNSKSNGRLLASGICDELFVQPAAGDDGVALGAALTPLVRGKEQLPLRRMSNTYLGDEFLSEEIENALKAYRLQYRQLGDPPAFAAELIAGGKIIGWFQGRMEFGPRALGNRSILADPREPSMKQRVNIAVKFREAWRPFAPSILAECAEEFLESAHDSPFMILTAQVRPEKRSAIPAVTHVDGSTRPHTVRKDVNPLYWRLIREFQNRAGVPVVLNTSFNLRGEPIVRTPTEAIRTFFTSGMDALILGEFLVEK